MPPRADELPISDFEKSLFGLKNSREKAQE
jgi:hypothetical protein